MPCFIHLVSCYAVSSPQERGLFYMPLSAETSYGEGGSGADNRRVTSQPAFTTAEDGLTYTLCHSIPERRFPSEILVAGLCTGAVV